MLTKKDIINKYNQVELDFLVEHGAALVMRGLREATRDIDGGVPRLAFEQLDEEPQVIKGFEVIPNYKGIEGLDIHPYDDAKVYTTIKGIRVATLGQVIKDKEKLGRDKDLEQIELIRRYKDDRYRNRKPVNR